MVSGVSSTNSYQYSLQTGSTSNSLTDDQKSKLQDIISQYDPSSMTQDDMKSMMDQIKEAGIKPSKDLRETLDAAGFQPPEKPQGPPPTSSSTQTSSTSSSSSSDISKELLDFLQKQESGQVSKDDINSLVQKLTVSGSSSQGALVDQTA